MEALSHAMFLFRHLEHVSEQVSNYLLFVCFLYILKGKMIDLKRK